MIEVINDLLWSYVLVIALLFCALYFTVRSRFVQFRMFGEMVRLLADSTVSNKKGRNNQEHHQISSFHAFAISLASRVGTGNLQV